MTAGHLLAAGQTTSTGASVAFWVLAVISVLAGLGMVLARRAVHCAVLLAVVMLSLAILYAVAAYLTLDLPARLLAGRVHFTGAGFLVFLCAVGLSLLGVSRMLHDAAPVAPVRPRFARAMLLAGWAAALLLTFADLAG